MPTTSPIRVLLADDHPGFRNGVRSRMEREPGIEVVGEAGTVAETIERVGELAPDVLLLDMELPDGSGADVMAALTAAGAEGVTWDGNDQNKTLVHKPHVLVLSAFDEPAYVFAVLDQGAAGYLSKEEPLAAVIEAVRGVANGEMGWLSRKISTLILSCDRPAPLKPPTDPAEDAGLSEREREVLLLLARGLPNPSIADQLFISESTVKKHVYTIYDKLRTPTRAAAVAWAWRNGLVEREVEE